MLFVLIVLLLTTDLNRFQDRNSQKPWDELFSARYSKRVPRGKAPKNCNTKKFNNSRATLTATSGVLVDVTFSVLSPLLNNLNRIFYLDITGEDVWYVVLSPDNSLVVTSRIGSLSAWRLSNGQRVFSVKHEYRTAAPICVLEKEKTALLATIISTKIKFHDLHTGRLMLETQDSKLPQHGAMRAPLCLCPLEDHSVLYASGDKLSPASWIRKANVYTNEVLELIKISSNHTVHYIGVTNSGMVLLALSEGAPNMRKGSAVQTTFFTLELWDIKNNVLVRRLADPSNKVRCYALSADKSKALTLGNSRFLASANVFQAEIKVFDLATEDITERTFAYPSSIHLMVFIDPNHVITASRDKIVRLWDLDRHFPSNSENIDEEDEVEIVDMYGYRAICWEKNALRVVDLQAGQYIKFANGVKPQLVFVTHSEVILMSAGKMHLFDLNQRQRIRQFDGDVWDEGLPSGCFVCMEDKAVAVSSDQSCLRVYDIHTGKVISEMQCEQIRR